jgi:hypothetical protein
MGKFPIQANVAGGVNARIVRLQVIVYQDALARVVLDSRGLQIQSFNNRRTAGSDQNLIDNDARLCPLRFVMGVTSSVSVSAIITFAASDWSWCGRFYSPTRFEPDA